jgi:hypothetical protein
MAKALLHAVSSPLPAAAAGSWWSGLLPKLGRPQRFASWQVEKVAIAPSLSPEARQAIKTAGYLP